MNLFSRKKKRTRSVFRRKIVGKRAVNILRIIPRSLSNRRTCLDPLSGGRQEHNSCARANRTKKRDCVSRRGVTKPPADARLYRWQLRRHALCIFALRAAVQRSYTTRSSHWKRDGVVTNPERTEIASPLPRQYLTAVHNKCTCSSYARGRILALVSLEMRGFAYHCCANTISHIETVYLDKMF